MLRSYSLPLSKQQVASSYASAVCNGHLSLHRDKQSNGHHRNHQSWERTRGELGAAIPTLESSGTAGTGRHKIQVVGAHRIWGTVKTVLSSLSSVISHTCKIDGGLRVKCKTKGNPMTHRTKWWFVIHADEQLLSDPDAKWELVKLQTP